MVLVAVVVLVLSLAAWRLIQPAAPVAASVEQGLDCPSSLYEAGLGGFSMCFPADWDKMTKAQRLEWANNQQGGK